MKGDDHDWLHYSLDPTAARRRHQRLVHLHSRRAATADDEGVAEIPARMTMNEGLQAWYARLALSEMDARGIGEWWIGDDLVTRFECERILGVGELDE